MPGRVACELLDVAFCAIPAKARAAFRTGRRPRCEHCRVHALLCRMRKALRTKTATYAVVFYQSCWVVVTNGCDVQLASVLPVQPMPRHLSNPDAGCSWVCPVSCSALRRILRRTPRLGQPASPPWHPRTLSHERTVTNYREVVGQTCKACSRRLCFLSSLGHPQSAALYFDCGAWYDYALRTRVSAPWIGRVYWMKTPMCRCGVRKGSQGSCPRSVGCRMWPVLVSAEGVRHAVGV